MITLYLKTGCGYCARVLAVVDAYQIPFIEKNISSSAVCDELETIGGKVQAPFMIDGDVQMYEANNIVAYLEKEFGAKQGDVHTKPKVYFADGNEVCPT